MQAEESLGGFSDEEEPAVVEPPYLVSLDDGRTVVIDPHHGKQLLLPGNHDWSIQIGSGPENHVLLCKSDAFPKRYVHKALESSRATAIGEVIPAVVAKPKPAVQVKVASPTTPAPNVTKASSALPPASKRLAVTPKQSVPKPPAPAKAAAAKALPAVVATKAKQVLPKPKHPVVVAPQVAMPKEQPVPREPEEPHDEVAGVGGEDEVAGLGDEQPEAAAPEAPEEEVPVVEEEAGVEEAEEEQQEPIDEQAEQEEVLPDV